MKTLLSAALVWLSILAAAAQGGPAVIPRFWVFGGDYVRLEDWARSRGGLVSWTVPRQEVKVSLPGGALIFNVDSRKARVRGVHVSLSAPVAYRHGSAYIGALDVTSALNPLLSPSLNPAGRQIKTIVLDPGHGGKDPGNMEGVRQEKHYTLTFAREVSELLTQAGFKVSLTRNTDSLIDLPVRPDIARRRGADLFISLHFNSADGPGSGSVKGSEVYCLTPARASSTNSRGEGGGAGASPGNRFDAKNVLLAWELARALSQRPGVEDRGVKRARYAVLRTAEMPAVLIEAAFMTHPADARRIYDPALRRQMAQAIVDGVLAYRKRVER